MQRSSKLVLPAIAFLVMAFLPAQALAQAEVSPFVGFLFGSSLDPDPAGPATVDRQFANSFTWGTRVGYFFDQAPYFGLEGSFTQSPFADFEIAGAELSSRATYVDMNAVFQRASALAKFYGTAGLGITRFRLGASEGGQTHTKLGFNFGAGVKVPMWTQRAGTWGLRFDVRDHWLRMDADDSMRSSFRDQLRLPPNSQTSVHNVVTTIAAYFEF